MTPLEDQLRALGDELAWPATPDIAAAVVPRLEPREPARARGRRHWLPSSPAAALAVALAALLLALAGVLAASPETRADLLHWLGFGSVRIEYVRELPKLRTELGPELGRQVPLAEAETAAGFKAPVPRALGRTDAVFVRRTPLGVMITVLYKPRRGLPRSTAGVGLLVSAVEGEATMFFKKIVEGGGNLDFVDVNNQDGVWIQQPHGVVIGTADGRSYEQPPRLAGPTLIWDGPTGISYRLEGQLSKEAALRIARSVR